MTHIIVVQMYDLHNRCADVWLTSSLCRCMTHIIVVQMYDSHHRCADVWLTSSLCRCMTHIIVVQMYDSNTNNTVFCEHHWPVEYRKLKFSGKERPRIATDCLFFENITPSIIPLPQPKPTTTRVIPRHHNLNQHLLVFYRPVTRGRNKPIQRNY